MLCKQANSRFALWYFWNPPCQYFRFTVTWISRYRILGCEGLTLIRKYAVSPNLIVAIQLLSRVRLFAALWTAARQASLSFTISQSLLKFMSIESVTPSNHLILFHPLHLPPSVFPSIRVFSNELALGIRWPNYWSFSVSSSSEYSGLISFRGREDIYRYKWRAL